MRLAPVTWSVPTTGVLQIELTPHHADFILSHVPAWAQRTTILGTITLHGGYRSYTAEPLYEDRTTGSRIVPHFLRHAGTIPEHVHAGLNLDGKDHAEEVVILPLQGPNGTLRDSGWNVYHSLLTRNPARWVTHFLEARGGNLFVLHISHGPTFTTPFGGIHGASLLSFFRVGRRQLETLFQGIEPRYQPLVASALFAFLNAIWSSEWVRFGLMKRAPPETQEGVEQWLDSLASREPNARVGLARYASEQLAVKASPGELHFPSLESLLV